MTTAMRYIGCGASDWSARGKRRNANALFWSETNASSIGITTMSADVGERAHFCELV